MKTEKVSVIVPTYNAGAGAAAFFKAVKSSALVREIIVIDSGSSDGTVKTAREYFAKVIRIKKRDFDHGGARNKAAKKAKSRILVYMTQDAMPEGRDSIKKLVLPLFKDKATVISYGRQLPAAGATLFAAHLRNFNYPEKSRIKRYEDKSVLGIKTAFVSNSFAAYRRDFLEKSGWFKTGLSMGEDVCSGATALKAGHKISYTAGARAYHSHNYGIIQEFKRYFEIGYFYRKEKWILEEFGAAESEGLKFIASEIKYLSAAGKWYLAPLSFLRAAVKLLGYKAGQLKAFLENAAR